MNEKVSPLPPFKSEKPFLDPNSLNEYKGDWSACCCPHIWTMTSVLLMFARIDSTNGSVNFSTSEIKIGNNYLKDVPVQVSRTIFPTRIGNCVLLSLAVVMERTNTNVSIWDGYLSLVIAGGVDNKLQSGKTLFCSYFSLQLTGGFAFWKEASDVIVSSCRIKESQPCVVIRVICWQKVLRENKAHQLHSGSSWTLDKGVKKGV